MKTQETLLQFRERINTRPLPDEILIVAVSPKHGLFALNGQQVARQKKMKSYPLNEHGNIEYCCKRFCRAFKIDHIIVIPWEPWMMGVNCQEGSTGAIQFKDSGIVGRLRLDKYGVIL